MIGRAPSRSAPCVIDALGWDGRLGRRQSFLRIYSHRQLLANAVMADSRPLPSFVVVRWRLGKPSGAAQIADGGLSPLIA